MGFSLWLLLLLLLLLWVVGRSWEELVSGSWCWLWVGRAVYCLFGGLGKRYDLTRVRDIVGLGIFVVWCGVEWCYNGVVLIEWGGYN